MVDMSFLEQKKKNGTSQPAPQPQQSPASERGQPVSQRE